MKLRLSILLLAAAALAATQAAGQTVKSLGYNTTNGQIVYSGSNSLTFTNALQFSTNARATTRTNLGLGGSDSVTFSNLSLGANGSLAIGGMNLTAITSGIDLAFKRAGSTELELKTNGLILHVGSYDFSAGNTNGASTTRTNLGLGGTNDVSFSRLSLSNGATNNLAVTLGATNRGFSATSGPDRITTTVAGISAFSVFSNSIETGSGVVANFATNVSVGGTLTATGNATLNGSGNLAPSQTADSASSLMTRNLYDERLPLAFGLMDAPQADFGTVTLANGASGSKAAGGFDLTTGASNNATSVWNASTQATFGRKNTAGISGVSTVWSSRVMVGWWFLRALSTNSEIRLQYGRAYNATTHAALSARGVGVRISTNSVFFETHDGTTGFETTNAVTATNPMLYWAIVEAGVAKFYAGTTLVATVTNNVPTNNSSGNDFGWVMSMSNTSTNSSIMRVLGNPGFVMQQ